MVRSSREMRDPDASPPGHETGVASARDAGAAVLRTISDEPRSPVYSESFGEQIVEWLLAHPKPADLVH